MFYTLISQTPFINNDISSKKIFKLFLIGSIIYIALHYYLFSSPRGILDNYKRYVYYVMAFDFLTAYLLTTFFGRSEEKEIAKQMILANKLKQQEELKQIEEKYNENIRLQQQNTKDNEIFNKKENDESRHSSSSKSTKNNRKSSEKKISEKKEETISNKEDDTDIPTYKDKEDN